MRNVIIIRDYNKDLDRIGSKEVVQNSIMSHASFAFFTFLFKEAVLQVMVLLGAISFIFLGLPIYLCISVIPLVTFSVFLITYSVHYFKAAQISESNHIKCWVAEAFEPYFMNSVPKDIKYGLFNDYEYKSEDIDTTSYSSKIIGVVSVKDFYGPDNSLWLYGLAVHPKYQRKHVATMLLRRLIDDCSRNNYDSIEVVITDLQCEARLLFQKEGFQMRQIYHRYVASMIPMGKFHMSLRLPCK